jgi:RecA-family ATPase
MSITLSATADCGFVVHSFAGDNPIASKDYTCEKLGLPKFKATNGQQPHSDNDMAKVITDAIANLPRDDGPKGKPTAVYPYTDADGKLLYEVWRFEPKRFVHRLPDGTFKGSDRRVIYRWPELLKYPDATVIITEGEKDADNVAARGFVATTVASGKWTDDCVKALAGRDCWILQDNDDPGRKKAMAAAEVLHPFAKTVKVILLPGLSKGGDVSDWLETHNKEDLERVQGDAPYWEPAPSSPEIKDKAPEPPLPFIDIAAWHSAPVPERQWVVRDRVPLAAVTLLSGDGGVGKTVLALQLAAATALGRDWLQALPDPGRVLVVCCEDDGDELHRRLDRIIQHCGASFEELSKSMHLLSLAGKDAVLAAPDKSGLIVPTEMCKRLDKTACDLQPRLIVIDNSADVFAGNENDRAQVRQFVTLLRGMAIRANAGLLLTSHPSLAGISSGTGLSGSTAWNASVRSRLYFKRAVTEKDEEPDPDLRVLEVMKANYGPIGETVTVRWNNKGLFQPVAGMSSLDKLAAEQKTEHLFLALLDRFNGQGRNTCEKPNAPTYAPTMFTRESEAREMSIRKVDFEGAMRRLFAADRICLEPYGPPSKATSRLVRK